MLINTELCIALSCPACGKMSFETISRFSFGEGKPVKINCQCGSLKLILGTKSHRQYWVQVPCVLCETNHLAYYKPNQFWSGEVNYLYCHDTGVDLGFFGPEDKVKAIAQNYEQDLQTMVEEMGYDDYFINPEIMFEVLNCLHDIAEEGYLYCDCGNNQVEVDIFPDRIELQCRKCETKSIVYAESEKDLEQIRQAKKIKLVREGFKCLDSLSGGKKVRRKKKTRH